jgi:hypothetical protein
MNCTICSIAITDLKTHKKSDHHIYNLKRKVRGLEPISVADFDSISIVKAAGGSKVRKSVNRKVPSPSPTTVLSETQCIFCTETFDSHQSTEIHIEEKHGLYLPANNTRSEVIRELYRIVSNLECISCGKVGHSIEGIRHHMAAKNHFHYELQLNQVQGTNGFTMQTCGFKGSFVDIQKPRTCTIGAVDPIKRN